MSLDVLDGRFPIDASREQEPFYQQLISEWWRHSSAFVADERARTAYQAGVQSVIAATGGERRYVLDETSPWQLPDDWYRTPYRALAPEELAHEWDTTPRTAIETSETSP